jgi:hypothetical protein
MNVAQQGAGMLSLARVALSADTVCVSTYTVRASMCGVHFCVIVVSAGRLASARTHAPSIQVPLAATGHTVMQAPS